MNSLKANVFSDDRVMKNKVDVFVHTNSESVSLSLFCETCVYAQYDTFFSEDTAEEDIKRVTSGVVVK